MLVLWIQENVQVVAQLSITDLWNQQSQKMDNMIITREDYTNILRWVDFSRLSNVIYQFPKLSPEFLKIGITFSLWKSKR